jgi:methylmalonyl-CoA mutase C-terminal domain/subunit
MSHKRLKVLIAKPGLDGHDRGAKVVARALRDAGMEVIYTGIRQTPEMIIQAALQEDVDVIGLSCLSGAHLELFGDVMAGLLKNKMLKVNVIAGGIVPAKDIPALEKMGIKKVFGPGTKTSDIIETIKQLVAGK